MQSKLKFWLTLILFNAILIYIVAFAGNFMIAQTLMLLPNPEARAIEHTREMEEDEPQRKAALAEGYAPTVYPGLFADNVPDMKELGERTGFPLLGGLMSERSYYCNEGYGLLRETTDRFGYRNDDGLWNDVTQTDVMMIGDSFVRGACVKDSETMAAVLNKGGLRTLNLGSGGNAPIHYASIAKTFIPAVKPKQVVLVFYANDNKSIKSDEALKNDLYYKRYFEGDAAANYLEAQGLSLFPSAAVRKVAAEAKTIILKKVNETVSAADMAIEEEKIREKTTARSPFLTAKYWELWHTKQLVKGLFKTQTLDAASMLAIDTLADECAKAGCKALVAFIPPSEYWRPDNRAKAYAGMLAGHAGSKGLPFLDLTPALEPMGRDAYALKGPHLSPAGYAAAGSTIEAGLKNQ